MNLAYTSLGEYASILCKQRLAEEEPAYLQD